jgi:hypothetical protein
MEYQPEDEEPVLREARCEPRAKSAFVEIVRIALTTVILPIVVSLIVSYYVNTHLLKPKLRVRYAVGNLFFGTTDKPNEFFVGLTDMTNLNIEAGSRQEIEAGKAKITGGVLLALKSISFKSSSDYIRDDNELHSLLYQIMLSNQGAVTANHLKLGFRCPKGTDVRKLIPSPNIRVTQETVPPSGPNPEFLNVSIDRLSASGNAALTVMCGGQPRLHGSNEYMVIAYSDTVNPILYISSDEGDGEVTDEWGIPYKEAEQWEQYNLPNFFSGFWLAVVHPKKGVVPKTKDIGKEGLVVEHTYLIRDSAGKDIPGTLVFPGTGK